MCVVAAVARVVATAQPPVEYTCSKYREAHSAVVGSAAYNRALDIADGVVRRVQVSTYKGSLSLHSIKSLRVHLNQGCLVCCAGYICLPGSSKPTVSSCQPDCRPCSGQADTLPSVHCCERSPHAFQWRWRWLSPSCHANHLCAMLSHGEKCC